MTIRRTWWAWGFLAAPLLAYGITVVWPALYSFAHGFTDWQAVGGGEFVGLEQFRRMTADPSFLRALRNTLIWTVLAVVVPTIAGLALALALNRVTRFAKLIKSIFFLPLALSLVVVGQVWFWIYRPEDGLLNLVLGAVGLESWGHAWLSDPDTALWAVMIAWGWQQVALAMVIFLAGLTSVSRDLTEAAHMDGAGAWARLRAVVLPALRPSFVVVTSLSLINALKSFDIVYVMTGGGPFRQTETLAVLAYRVSFKTYDFGYGSAVSVVLFVVSVVIIGLFFAWNSWKDRHV
ncbi:carbohydrate ABC transporter permease [Nonomuraea rubra]|uniref:Multiple sugar transport system permease protein/raffinose/stachyose/melibiose transport system permease protein n=1 Tax=Nonomuraea rubra TaxID=46180 RepID=A0A7X0NWY8_9ACTN|nr:sugar ABC transporter permease [Nonomuraea rubra]MBB6551107.1 multiple sugar transport system permease protein/raffinose/stachyose/melibiose transport system permease protein [Nonomuraea rubra]